MHVLIRILAYTWAAPWTLLGLMIGVVGVATGGHGRRRDGVLEFWGGMVPWVLSHAPLVGNAAALTLGHVVLGRSEIELDGAHTHELVHVRQFERWGPLFIPCYLLASFAARLAGGSAYHDNVFEREAYGRLDRPLGEGRVARAWLKRAYFLGALCVIATVASWAGRRWWLFELTCHFVLCYAIGLGLAILLLWINGRFRAAVCVSPFLIVNLWGVMPLYFVDHAPPISAKPMRLVSTNVLSSNPNPRPLMNWIRREKPDVIVAQEVNKAWSVHLSSLRAEYPHRIASVRDDNFGIMLLSRLPIASQQMPLLGGIEVPCIVARIEHDGQRLTIIVIHVLPPISPRWAAERNRELADVVEVVRQQPRPVMLVGDFNCTSWSPVFHDVLRDSRLRDSRRGFGLQASWPNYLGRFGLPIDHCLVSREVGVYDRRIGPNIGSDHFPVLVDFGLVDQEAGFLNHQRHELHEK